MCIFIHIDKKTSMKYVEHIFCWFFWVLFFSCFSTIHDVCWFVRCFWYWADAPPIWRCDDLCSGHVFQGVYKEPQMIQIMDRFRAQLGVCPRKSRSGMRSDSMILTWDSKISMLIPRLWNAQWRCDDQFPVKNYAVPKKSTLYIL